MIVHGDARTIEVFSDPSTPRCDGPKRDGRSDLGLVGARSRALEPRAGGPPRTHRAVLGRIGPVGGHRAWGRRHDHRRSSLRRQRPPSVASARISASCARRSRDRTNRHFERGLSAAWHHLDDPDLAAVHPERSSTSSAGCRPGPHARRARSSRSCRPGRARSTGDAGRVRDRPGQRHRRPARSPRPRQPAWRNPSFEAEPRTHETLVVTRTRTASRALLDALGADPDAGGVGSLTVCPIGRLHREGTWPRAADGRRAVPVGLAPPALRAVRAPRRSWPSASTSARACATMVRAVRAARDHWGSDEVRGRTWRHLLGADPPPAPAPVVRPSGQDRSRSTAPSSSPSPIPSSTSPPCSVSIRSTSVARVRGAGSPARTRTGDWTRGGPSRRGHDRPRPHPP